MKKYLFLILLVNSFIFPQQLGKDITAIIKSALSAPTNPSIGIYFNAAQIPKISWASISNPIVDQFFSTSESFTVYFLKNRTAGDVLSSKNDIEHILKIESAIDINPGTKQSTTKPKELTLINLLSMSQSEIDNLKEQLYQELNKVKFSLFGQTGGTPPPPNYNNTYYYIEDQKRNSGHLYDFSKTGLSLDISPSKLTIYWEDIYKPTSEVNLFGATEKSHLGLGFEVSSQEKTLNILPLQSNAVFVGLRFLPLGIGTTANELKKAGLDFRLYYKYNTNISDVIMNKRAYFLYFGNSEEQSHLSKLNSSNGIATDIHYFNDPLFLNLYVSYSVKDYKNNFNKMKNINDELFTSYFSFMQAEMSMSFYWGFYNTHFFKVDLGGGFYDVYSANYTENNDLKNSQKVQNVISPLIGFQYNIVINKNDPATINELLGINLKYFSYRAKLGAWMKLLQIRNNTSHKDSFIARLETFYLTNRFVGTENPWDDKGGIVLQLRGIF